MACIINTKLFSKLDIHILNLNQHFTKIGSYVNFITHIFP